MKKAFSFAVLLLITLCLPFTGMAQEAQVDRTELPIKGPWYPPITTLDARDAKAPPVFEVKAPKDAPNVVVILLDDLGFGGTSAFGGVIETPHFDKLASQGLMYNQFHTTALCSPNYLGIDRFTAKAGTKLPKGKSTVKLDFAYKGKKPGMGGTATLYINDKSVGTGEIGQTEFAIFSADETAGVGLDAETPVSPDYDRASSKFTGKIHEATITLK